VDIHTLDHVPVAGAGAGLSAVLVHPHPHMGGDRFNHVIDAIYRALPGSGVGVARFDLSSADAEESRLETLAAVDNIAATRVALVGYSFGADVALGIDDARVVGWFAVAPPLRLEKFDAVAMDDRPKSLLVAQHDQFSPPERVAELTQEWRETTRATLDGADHFLAGYGAAVAEAVRAWILGLQPLNGGGAEDQ
jgi:alpha/beta superfamily hydrolase